jgi:hypothetical protein
MSNTNTGGPAFPQTEVDRDGVTITHHSGMTLRDYFAAKAMQSVWKDIPEDANRQQALDYLGKCCYEMADAMLKAREA